MSLDSIGPLIQGAHFIGCAEKGENNNTGHTAPYGRAETTHLPHVEV